jgi:hypothetical protein
MLVPLDGEAAGEQMERQRALAPRLSAEQDQPLAADEDRRPVHERRPRRFLLDSGVDRSVDPVPRFGQGALDVIAARQRDPEAVRGRLRRKLDWAERCLFDLRSGLDEAEVSPELGRLRSDAVFAADAADDDGVQGSTRSSSRSLP